jgi:hypothetical protein
LFRQLRKHRLVSNSKFDQKFKIQKCKIVKIQNFLCTSVKIHFFKTFILPYFDYCLSLIIYFPSSAYQSLCNCFNFCLYKLFKFSTDFSSDDKDEETVMSEFVEKLHSYELFTFQSRIYNKVLFFAHGIKTNSRSPLELKSYLEMEVSDEEQPTEQPETIPPGIVPSDVEYTQTDVRKVQPIQEAYSLRGRTIIKSIIPETKFETLTFKHFFPRLLKTFNHFDFTLRKDSFKTQVNLFLRENIKIFSNKFPKFDIKYSAYYRKKKKNLSKAKRARAK